VTLAELVDLLASMGSAPSEGIDGLSELDHGLQCAWVLAQIRPDDRELQVAGLVHDIGHRFGSDQHHGDIGAELVRPVLGDRVAGLVEAHVPAKRYLVAKEESYRSELSDDSTRTLAIQGGALEPGEILVFLSSPYAPDALELRRADDAAKVPGRAVPDLAHWIEILQAEATLQGAGVLRDASTGREPRIPRDAPS
jgi:predicted HD phosphohydrolase